ncbi:MAG TPA: hypothetical protein VLE74_01980 [Candidatus Saccharimonadales bacterium]|nr:hypothetical protein [Candidatus Saccharimonadales bacterium]
MIEQLSVSADTHITDPQSAVPNLAFAAGTYDLTQAEFASLCPAYFTQPEGLRGTAPETPESIAAFTPETARSKLAKLPFLAHDLTQHYQGPEMIFRNVDEGFEIPVDRIVHADGYIGDNQPSWAGRANDPASTAKIVGYAKRGKYRESRTSLRESIDLYTLFTPEGEIFFSATSGNRRVSAAKLRGDQTISVANIHITRPEVATLTPDETAELYAS